MFSEVFIDIKVFSLMKLHLKMSSAQVAAILSWPQYVNTLVLRKTKTVFILKWSAVG